MRFVFYDTETTGPDTTFDQILQFAAILLVLEFNRFRRLALRNLSNRRGPGKRTIAALTPCE